jgi:ketosteroid isomerase-like protein
MTSRVQGIAPPSGRAAVRRPRRRRVTEESASPRAGASTDGGPVSAALTALEAKDLDGFLALLTDDATLVDPHYPVERMVGKEAIADGMRWLFGTMRSLSFEVTDRLSSSDGRRVAVELVARHVAPGNRTLETPQVLVIDIDGERLSHIRAYQPYGPGGSVGLFLSAIRAGRKSRRAWSRFRVMDRLRRRTPSSRS